MISAGYETEICPKCSGKGHVHDRGRYHYRGHLGAVRWLGLELPSSAMIDRVRGSCSGCVSVALSSALVVAGCLYSLGVLDRGRYD